MQNLVILRCCCFAEDGYEIYKDLQRTWWHGLLKLRSHITRQKFENGSFTLKTRGIKTQQLPIVLDLCLKKTLSAPQRLPMGVFGRLRPRLHLFGYF